MAFIKTISVLVSVALLTSLVPSTAFAQVVSDARGSEVDSVNRDAVVSSEREVVAAQKVADVEAVTSEERFAVLADTAGPVVVYEASDPTTPHAYNTLEEAFSAAHDGAVIEILQDIILTKPLELSDSRKLTLRSQGNHTIKRATSYPTVGSGSPAGMIRLRGQAQLSLGGVDENLGMLTLDGALMRSAEALVSIDGNAKFSLGSGANLTQGYVQSSAKLSSAVQVNSGEFILDGGSITDSFGFYTAAVAVEPSASMTMIAGSISSNDVTTDAPVVRIAGSADIHGGEIVDNAISSGASTTGVLQVVGGGSLSLTGATLRGNSLGGSSALRVETDASLELGGDAQLDDETLGIVKGATVKLTSVLNKHGNDAPLTLRLYGEWDVGEEVMSASSAEILTEVLLGVSAYGSDGFNILSLGVSPTNPLVMVIAEPGLTELFELLNSPYADSLKSDLKAEFWEPNAFETMRAEIVEHFAQSANKAEEAQRLAQVDQIERIASYMSTNRSSIDRATITLSKLGDPVAEANRTQQDCMFDNLDATGYYLKPTRTDFKVYVEADDPSLITLAWRQAGVADSNSYMSLIIQERSGLVNGENNISIDLSGSQRGYMLYVKNKSEDNNARIRIEASDALETNSVEGTSLGAHPLYIHDPNHPEAFWPFVQEVKEHAARINTGGDDTPQDMAFLQMGDTGNAQFAISATGLNSAYAKINSETDAISYIEKSNDAIQNRLEFYWGFDGFDPEATAGDIHAVTPMRVYTSFTKNVTIPSTMFATQRYFHMSEASAAGFLSGASMYGWGMSHEYGHMLDNRQIAIAEQTNNLYSIAGVRQGGLNENGDIPYHQNLVTATKRQTSELEQNAKDPSYTPDWNNGGNSNTAIWTHVLTWWNGLHYFDSWDYSDYDYSSSPYTPEIAQDVATYGAYGAAVRQLRDPEVAAKIRSLSDTTSDTGARKYNRIALAFTMAIGYNFAEYLQFWGENDFTAEVLAECSKYPSMPRKVQYYNLDADTAELKGVTTYGDDVTPLVDVTQKADGNYIYASMSSQRYIASTIAYELYRGDTLIGFSRTGQFVDPHVDTPITDYKVISYDIRLNTSKEGRPVPPEPVITIPQLSVGDSGILPQIEGPEGATYKFSVRDESVASVDPTTGALTAHALGSTQLIIIMSIDGREVGSYRKSITVVPRRLHIGVNDINMYVGQAIPEFSVTILSGELLPGDSLGTISYAVKTEGGEEVAFDRVGTYVLDASVPELASNANYLITIHPGSLSVKQESIITEGVDSWISLLNEQGSALAEGQWSAGDITLSASSVAFGQAGSYELIALDSLDNKATSHTISQEGEVSHQIWMEVQEGEYAGAITTATSFTTRIDKTAPVVNIQEQDEVLSITAEDVPAEGVSTCSDLERIELKVFDEANTELDFRSEQSASLNYDLSTYPVGMYRVEIQGFDHAGNSSELITKEFERKPTTPPVDPGDPDVPSEPEEGYLGYPDVDPNHWAALGKVIDWAEEHQAVSGYEDGRWAPDDTITRADAATVIWKLAGQPAATSAVTFPDVSTDVYFAEAIAWCDEQGIFDGDAMTGNFFPYREISREEVTKILCMYVDGTWGSADDFAHFADASSVSPWAHGVFGWAVTHQVITGRVQGDNTFVAGQDLCTRAEFVKMLMVSVEGSTPTVQ